MASSPTNDDSLMGQGWIKTRTAWASVASDDNQVAEQEEARRKAMAARVPEDEARARDRDLLYGYQPPPSRVVGAFDMIAVEEKNFMPPLDNLTAAQTALAPVKRLDFGGGFTPNEQYMV